MRRLFLILSALFLVSLVVGQDVKQDFADGEFFLAEEDYEEALYTFTKVYNNGYQDNANINYRIGICLLQIPGRKVESVPYLEKAVRSVSEKYNEGSLKEVNAPPDVHLYLGNAGILSCCIDMFFPGFNHYPFKGIGQAVPERESNQRNILRKIFLIFKSIPNSILP